MIAVELQLVTKTFGTVRAVDDLSLQVGSTLGHLEVDKGLGGRRRNKSP